MNRSMLALLAALGCGAAGCTGSGTSGPCTLIGCEDGFALTVTVDATTVAAGTHTLRVTADGTVSSCTFTFPPPDAGANAIVPTPCSDGLTVSLEPAMTCTTVQTPNSSTSNCQTIADKFEESILLPGMPQSVRVEQRVDGNVILDRTLAPAYRTVEPSRTARMRAHLPRSHRSVDDRLRATSASVCKTRVRVRRSGASVCATRALVDENRRTCPHDACLGRRDGRGCSRDARLGRRDRRTLSRMASLGRRDGRARSRDALTRPRNALTRQGDTLARPRSTLGCRCERRAPLPCRDAPATPERMHPSGRRARSSAKRPRPSARHALSRARRRAGRSSLLRPSRELFAQPCNLTFGFRAQPLRVFGPLRLLFGSPLQPGRASARAERSAPHSRGAAPYPSRSEDDRARPGLRARAPETRRVPAGERWEHTSARPASRVGTRSSCSGRGRKENIPGRPTWHSARR